MGRLIGRLRWIASMAGAERLAELEETLRTRPWLARPLLEGRDPLAMARALGSVCAELGVEAQSHTDRLEARTRLLAGALNLTSSETDDAALGALSHDVGKISIADTILKSPLPLEAGSLDRIHMHSSLGHAVLFGYSGLRGAAQLVLNHHEYWDGTGYHGARGSEIPRTARIFAVVDSYDAMVADDRPYRAPVDHELAVAELHALRGIKYDPDVVDAFLDVAHGAWLEIDARLAA